MQRVDHAADPVFEEVWDVAEGITVREEIPATGAVAVVVEPGAEDQVGGDAEEDTKGKKGCEYKLRNDEDRKGR